MVKLQTELKLWILLGFYVRDEHKVLRNWEDGNKLYMI